MNEEKMKELEKKFNSKEFKDKIIRIQKIKVPQMIDVEVPEPPFPPMNIENFNWTDKSKLSKAEQKKLEKLSKERAELAKKQAEIARQQAEITGVKGKVFYYGTSAFSENANDAAKNFTKIKWSNSDALNNKNIKIYIDGKLVDKAEVEKLNPNDISSISVNKSKNNGAEDGEIKIETKK